MSHDYASAAFDNEISRDDPEYELKRSLFAEMKELRDKYQAEGLRRFALRRRVKEELAKRHKGRAWEIIKFLLKIFSIVLFFI